MNDKEIARQLEEMEAATRDNPRAISPEDFDFATQFIARGNNAQMREASRVVGNVAAAFPDKLDAVIPLLM